MISSNELKTFMNSNVSKLLVEEFYEINYINAIDLLTKDRIDVLIKILYIEAYITNKNLEFYKNLYLKHIELFNFFVEADSTKKVGKSAFLNQFNELIIAIKEKGFNPNFIIPINANSIPIDGAHRIAISIYFNIKIPVIQLKNVKNNHKFDFDFFIQRGLSSQLADHVALRLIDYIDSPIHSILIWPKAQKHDEELVKLLSSHGETLYFKSINFSLNGLTNLMREVYFRENWLGNYKNDFEGCQNKASQCYANSSPLRLFLFKPFSTTDLVELKATIRSIFQVQKHSIHINDTQIETKEIGELLLDDNNIHRLNFTSRKEMSKFNLLFEKFSNHINKNNLDINNYAIIGNILAVYGIKDASDLDYISIDNLELKIDDEIELETKKLEFTSKKSEELILNPENYFIYKGVKIISLQEIFQIKSNRNNLNDKYEVELLNELKQNKFVGKDFWKKIKNLTSIYYYKRIVKQQLLKLRFILYKYILKK